MEPYHEIEDLRAYIRYLEACLADTHLRDQDLSKTVIKHLKSLEDAFKDGKPFEKAAGFREFYCNQFVKAQNIRCRA